MTELWNNANKHQPWIDQKPLRILWSVTYTNLSKGEEKKRRLLIRFWQKAESSFLKIAWLGEKNKYSKMFPRWKIWIILCLLIGFCI